MGPDGQTCVGKLNQLYDDKVEKISNDMSRGP